MYTESCKFTVSLWLLCHNLFSSQWCDIEARRQRFKHPRPSSNTKQPHKSFDFEAFIHVLAKHNTQHRFFGPLALRFSIVFCSNLLDRHVFRDFVASRHESFVWVRVDSPFFQANICHSFTIGFTGRLHTFTHGNITQGMNCNLYDLVICTP